MLLDQPSELPTSSNLKSAKQFHPPSWIYDFLQKISLTGNENWLAWSMISQDIFEVAGVWDVVIGKETAPPLDSSEYDEWESKDGFASFVILSSVDPKIITPLVDKNAFEMWRDLRDMYQQTDPVSIVLWMRKLVRIADASTDLRIHIQDFEVALAHLAYAGVEFPEHIQSFFLLSTLSKNSMGFDSWTRFISNMQINESTTLSSTIAAILAEIRTREMADSFKANEKAANNTQKRRHKRNGRKSEKYRP